MADWNNDGLLDLVAAHNNEPAAVLLNSSVSNYPWVRIQLVGTQSPRDAIGARVVLHSSSKNQLRQVVGGGSFQSQNDLTVHFGVSIDTQVVRATVYWPSGIQQSVETLNLRQTNVVVEK